jgi:methylase of polypeptide subunit release factors
VITATALAACRGTEGLAALLASAGYEIAPRPIDPARWLPTGLDPDLARRMPLVHAARRGRLEILLGEGCAPPQDQTRFIDQISRWNVVLQFIVIYRNTNTGIISLAGLDARGRSRRIDVDPARPRRDALERFRALEIGAAPDEDLGRSLARALQRESVGRRFFLRFRDDARALEQDLLRLHPAETAPDRAGEALLILSRILFLYFVQQKGWLDGSRSFLANLVERSRRVREGIFTGVLLPLFFGCLNTPEPRRDPLARRFGKIPYLNGGLFEQSAYERRHPVIGIDDALLERIVFETFERFQFVIEEDDQTGAHIDPEMLGHVFENLMAADERLASGSFYTPKSVVDVLVANALAARLGENGAADALRVFLTGSSTLALPSPTTVRRELDRIRVIDPACGSGAFLLAALQQMERLARALGADNSGTAAARRSILERLHGIDLKPEAVRLCELRLWLAVAAAESTDPARVAPLPNLDRNILQGNTLLGPLDWMGSKRLEGYRWGSARLRERASLIERFRAARGKEREALARALRESDAALALEVIDRSLAADRRELDDLERRQRSLFGEQARRTRKEAEELQGRVERGEKERKRVADGEVGFFAPEVHFAEVSAAGGFDVVVGNPPWVRSSRIDPGVRQLVADRYASFSGGARGQGIPQGELSLAFFDRSLSMAREGGVVSLLMPQKIVTSGYAAAWRGSIARTAALLWLRDWSDEARRLFDADTFPLGVLARKGARPSSVRVERSGSSFRLPQAALPLRRGGPWLLAEEPVRAILRRLARECPRFIDRIGKPVMGVKTGANGDFFVAPQIDWARREAIVDGVPIPLDDLARVVRGRDIARWTAADSLWMLRPTRRSSWIAPLGAARGGRRLPPLAYERREHHGWKVVWRDVARGLIAATLPPAREINGARVGLVPNQTAYCAATANEEDAWFAAAVLNSSVAGAAAVAVADRAKDFHYRYFGRTIAELPVPAVTFTVRRRVAALARAAASGEGSEEEVEGILNAAYGITQEEAETLGRFVRERLGRA